MSYSAADLINDLELNADTYGVPALAPRHLAALGMDPTSEHDGNRILAERIARALSDRQDLGVALVALLAHIEELASDFDICRKISASSYGVAVRAAIAGATRSARPSHDRPIR